MKKLSIALAILATAIIATPALGWHVDTGDCTPAPKAIIREPYGDPYGRIVVRNDRSCRGWVAVPDASWVKGGYLTVDGTDVRIGRGESARLKAGSYTGRWTNSSEVEHFTIAAHGQSVDVVWRGIGKAGLFKADITVPDGCVYRSGYRWLKGSTKTWVQDRTHATRLATQRVSPPGYYKPLWHGYDKGLTCK